MTRYAVLVSLVGVILSALGAAGLIEAARSEVASEACMELVHVKGLLAMCVGPPGPPLYVVSFTAAIAGLFLLWHAGRMATRATDPDR
jgi:hypothetical protein